MLSVFLVVFFSSCTNPIFPLIIFPSSLDVHVSINLVVFCGHYQPTVFTIIKLKSRESSTDILYCIELQGWSLLPDAPRPFQIYCAPPNLGITRTWICPLNFAQMPIFSGLRFFNESEISDSGPQLKTKDFYVLKKSIDLSWVWTLDLEVSTLPRDHRGQAMELVN